MIAYHNKDVSSFNLNIGDIVFSLVNVTSSKLQPKFDGPFRVIAKLNGNKVKVLHLQSLEESITHLDSLKKVSKGFDSVLITPHNIHDTTPDTKIFTPPCPYNFRSIHAFT